MTYDVKRMVRDMKITRINCILMVTLLLAATSDIMAASDIMDFDFRCGSRIITIGDYRYDVLRKCGEPSHMEVWQEVRFIRDFGEGPVTVEGWEYNLGSTNFIRYLRFENGRLRRITVGDYGY